MFTFKPARKSGTNGNGNGHAKADTHATAGHGPLGALAPGGAGGNGDGPTEHNGNGNGSNGNTRATAGVSGQAKASTGDKAGAGGQGKPGLSLASWLGLGGGNHNGHAAERPAAGKNTRASAGVGGNGHSKRIDSVIGPGLSLRGSLVGSGGVRIEGNFDGTIHIQGPVLIADGAKVTAEIRAGAVSVAGSVKGNITAAKVEILSTGRVWGDLITTTFATEEGAFLRGQVRMEDELPAEERPEPEAEAA